MCYILPASAIFATAAMSTTTIRIEPAMKARIVMAAERVGQSPHAFILDSLSDTVERAEMNEEAHRIADQRWAALLRTGKSVGWADAKAYMLARAAGKKPRKPTARQPAP
jgi:predicted transcriptional regulator